MYILNVRFLKVFTIINLFKTFLHVDFNFVMSFLQGNVFSLLNIKKIHLKFKLKKKKKKLISITRMLDVDVRTSKSTLA
jgi:hypothetical protein